MPRIEGVLETSLYVDDLERSARFYQAVFGFEVIVTGERLCALVPHAATSLATSVPSARNRACSRRSSVNSG